MASIFQRQPLQTRPFPIETRVIWVPGCVIHKSFKVAPMGGVKFTRLPRAPANLHIADLLADSIVRWVQNGWSWGICQVTGCILISQL